MVNVTIDEQWCKGCELCVKVCPKGVIEMSKKLSTRGIRPAVVVEGSECIKCQACVLICPDTAITITETKGGDCD